MISYDFEKDGLILAVRRDDPSVRVWVEANARNFGDSGLYCIYALKDIEKAERFAKEIGAHLLCLEFDIADEA